MAGATQPARRWSRVTEGGRTGGRPKRVDEVQILHLTTQSQPANATHWTTGSLPEHTGCSDPSIRRGWRAHGLKAHRIETFKVSRDPQFIEKREDVVGLHLNPLAHALVLFCEGKSRVQALDRSQHPHFTRTVRRPRRRG